MNVKYIRLIFFREFSPTFKTYSGRECIKTITYKLPGGNWGIDEDVCVLGFGQIFRGHL